MKNVAVRQQPSCVRSGITLLEIILALTLFLGAITALAQLAWSGHRASIQARLRTEAVFRCESKLNELLTGAERFQSVQNVAFPDDAHWVWSSQMASGQYPELIHVQVTVRHLSNTPVSVAEFSLDRWTRDPALFLEAAQAQQQSQATTTTTNTTTSSSSTSSSQTGGSK